jgi:hypothetical protein
MAADKATKVQPVVLEDGRRGWLYNDGSIRGEHGVLLVKPKYPGLQDAEIKTSEQGRAMIGKRHAELARRFNVGVTKRALSDEEETKNLTEGAAWEKTGFKMADLLFSAKSARGAEGLLGQIAKLGDFVPGDRSRNQDAPVSADNALAALIMRLLEAKDQDRREVVSPSKPPPDVIEGQAKDV